MEAPDDSSTPIPGLYQCTQCQKTYTRVDHLARHVRSHSQERPFKCKICPKAFGRPDLLKRHALSHDPTYNATKRRKMDAASTVPRRVSQACIPCASSKVKCHEEKPCLRCRYLRISCTMSDNSPTSTSLAELDSSVAATEGCSPKFNSPHVATQALFNVPEAEDPFSDLFLDLGTPIQANALNLDQAPLADGEPEHNNALTDNPSLDESDISFFTHSLDTPVNLFLSGVIDDIFHTYDESHNLFAQWILTPQETVQAITSPSPTMNKVNTGPESHIHLEKRFVSEILDASARDKLLAMILTTCNEDEGERIAATFPSTHILDNLLQNFFHHNQMMPQSFIHQATFNPNIQKLELLGAIIAIGAVLSEVKAHQKLGFVLQEAVRLVLQKKYEKSNSIGKELWFLQALSWEIQIGLYSGNRRKREIAESHTQLLITTLRRTGYFQNFKSTSPGPLPEDTGSLLHQKWIEWVWQESCKRLAFHAFRLDTFASMSLLVNPLISYAEISSTIPESSELWMAENADQWKHIYMAQMKKPGYVSLVGLLQQPMRLSSIPRYYDFSFATLTVLHGLWGMIREYAQLASAMHVEHSQTDPIMILRYQGLCQKLSEIRTAVSTSGVDESRLHEVSLTIELLSMYQHVCLDSIHSSTGKKGLEEARQVLPSLQEWATVSSSRQAIWNAGQILRIARSYPHGSLRGFLAIAIYHAGLICWAYGLVAKMAPMDQEKSGPLAECTSPIFLDGQNSTIAQRFVTLGCYSPSITCKGQGDSPNTEHVALSDYGAVIGVVLDILKANIAPSTNGDALPPVVDDLVEQMHTLQIQGMLIISPSGCPPLGQCGKVPYSSN